VNNTACKQDCNGTWGGSAKLDSCGVCAGGTTGKTPCQKPFKEILIPGIVEAEFFDYGGQNISYFDTDTANVLNAYRSMEFVDIAATTNGYKVGRTRAGEWMEYTVKAQEGTYSVDFLYASAFGNGKFYLELDGVAITPQLQVANTGAWTTFQTVSANNISISDGVHVLRFNIVNQGFDLDRMTFKKQNVTSVDVPQIETTKLWYPNPVTKGVIRTNKDGLVSFKIMDMSGKVISESKANGNMIDVAQLQKGSYLLQSTFQDGVVTEKIAVE
jgi:hypothetical protein